MADLRISQLPAVSIPLTTDVLPVVNANSTKKININQIDQILPITTFVRANSANWTPGIGAESPSVRVRITGSSGLGSFYPPVGNTDNNTEYIMFFNDKVYETDISVIEANLTNKNIILKQTGTYLFNARYASYDLLNSLSNTLRLRMRGSTDPITTTSGGSLLYTLGDGIIGTSANGASFKGGSAILKVETVPYYVAFTFLHTGATGGAGSQGFPVVNNALGTVPFIEVVKI